MEVKKIFQVIFLIIVIVFTAWWIVFLMGTRIKPEPNIVNTLRYVAMGDSYTFGQDVSLRQTWPYLLAEHLRERGIPVSLHTVIAKSGWTSQQLIDLGLQGFKISKPDFATLLIGANDWVQYVDQESFRGRLTLLMDEMLSALPSPRRFIVLTIPDFSVTPLGGRVGGGRDISAGIFEFNHIIQEEANKRGVAVVDLFPLSREMAFDPELIVDDGLHPSAKEYARWEELIFPVAVELIQ